MSKKVEGGILVSGANERKNIMNEIYKQKMNNKKKNYSPSKLILIIIIILYSLLLLTISLFTLACTVKSSDNLAIGNYKFYLIKLDNNKIIPKGDLVVVKKVKNETINIGDQIVYKEDQKYYCYNVENTINNSILVEKNGITYQFTKQTVEGKIVKKYRVLGNLVMFLRAPIGIIIFLIFTVLLFVLLRILITKDDNI